MATDLVLDGMLSGTGVRDGVNGGYVELSPLGLSASLVSDISAWRQRYESCHFDGFPETVTELDMEGLALAARVDAELPWKSVGYYSNGLMKRLV